MLAIFFAIVGAFGVALNWPVLYKGVMAKLTGFTGGINSLPAFIQGFSPGFLRPDGIIVVAATICLTVTLFLRTTNILIIARSVILAIIASMLVSETYTAISQGSQRYSYTGLVFAGVFFCIAFVSSIFKFGSTKSLNSTIRGIPMTESQALTQTLKATLQAAATSLNVRLTPLDNLNPAWEKGETKEFDDVELRLGREPKWANIQIGDEWETISRRHGVLRTLQRTLFYDPVSKNYAFAVNDKPSQIAGEIPNNAVLSLISGLGPKIKIEYTLKQLPALHAKTFSKTAEIAKQEFKKLQTTLKVFVVLAVLGIPLFGASAKVQHDAWNGYSASIVEEKRQIDIALNKSITEGERLKAKIKEKEAAIEEQKKSRVIDKGEIEQLEKEKEDLEAELSRIKDKSIVDEPPVQKPMSIDKQFSRVAEIAGKIDKLYITKAIVFPIISVDSELLKDNKKCDPDKEGCVGTGTGFVARDSAGQFYLVTAAHVVNLKNENGQIKTSLSFIGGKKWTENVPAMEERLKEVLTSTVSWDEKIDNLRSDGIIDFESSEWKLTSTKYEIAKNNYDHISFIPLPSDIPIEWKEFAPIISRASNDSPFFGIFGYPVYSGDTPYRCHAVGTVDSTVDSIDANLIYGRCQVMGGFSGGPVVSISPNEDQSIGNMRVMAVVAAIKPVMKKEEVAENMSVFMRVPSEF